MRRILLALLLVCSTALAQKQVTYGPNGVIAPNAKGIAFTMPNGVTVPSTLGISKDIYLSIRTDNPPCIETSTICGSGTKLDPYDCSGSTSTIGADRLDAIWAAKQPNYNLHYAAGTYYTRGWYYFTRKTAGTGCKHFGAGIDETVIKLFGAANGFNDGVIFSHDATTADGFEVHGMTLDCDSSNQPGWASHTLSSAGIFVASSNDVVIDGVKVIHFGTSAAGRECFPILLGSGVAGNYRNNLITNCQAMIPATGNADGCTAISVSYTGDGVIGYNGLIGPNNYVDLTGSDLTYTHGIGVAGATAFNNTIKGCTSGIYSEPIGEYQGFTIRDNRLIGCLVSVNFSAHAGAHVPYIYVIGNNAEDSGPMGGGGFTDQLEKFDFVELSGNHYKKTDGTLNTTAPSIYEVNSATTLIVRDNTADSSYSATIRAGAANPPIVSNNRGADGGLLLTVDSVGNQLKQSIGVPTDVNGNVSVPASVAVNRDLAVSGNITGYGPGISGVSVAAGNVQTTRRTVIDTDYTVLTTGDDLIAYTTLTSPRSVHLPAANLCSGCVRSVQDETGSAGSHTITVDVASSGTINGSSTATITTNYGGKKFYSNASQWIIKP